MARAAERPGRTDVAKRDSFSKQSEDKGTRTRNSVDIWADPTIVTPFHGQVVTCRRCRLLRVGRSCGHWAPSAARPLSGGPPGASGGVGCSACMVAGESGQREASSVAAASDTPCGTVAAWNHGADGRWVVYLLRCRDRSLYCGITNDMPKRLKAHAAGKASRYTRSRLPVKVVYVEPQAGRSPALKREAAIKRLRRSEKDRLIAGSRLAVDGNQSRSTSPAGGHGEVGKRSMRISRSHPSRPS